MAYKYLITLTAGEDGYIVAECPSLPGCVSQGKTRDEALNGIKQFQPIFQGRFGDRLPLIESLLALKEIPFASDALSIDLQLVAFFGNAFPTDLGLGHLSLVLSPASTVHSRDQFRRPPC